MIMRNGVLSIILLLIAWVSFGAWAAPETRPAPSPAAVIQLHDEINQSTKNYFIASFNNAVANGAKTIIIDLDTYGGIVTSALEISNFIKSHKDIRTLVYVNDKAYSAGSIISFACDEIIMSPNAFIGDCAPIRINSVGEVVTMGAEERAKALSPIAADFLDSCNRNHHDYTLAIAMIASNIEVRWLKNPATGETRFADKPVAEPLLASKQWTEITGQGIPSPLDPPNLLLTFNSTLAEKTGLASSIAPSIEALAQSKNLQITQTFASTAWFTIVEFLNAPFIRTLLIILFLVCLFVSLHAPGNGVAEVLGLLSLVLAIGAPWLTGYAQWWDVLLIFIGIVLLAIELFIIPGFGIVGILGILCMVMGLVLTFVVPEAGKAPFSLPSTAQSWKSFQTGLIAVVSAFAVSMILMAVLRPLLPKLPLFRKLILTTNVGTTPSASAGSISNIEPSALVPVPGAKGVAITDLCPGGSAEFHDLAGAVHVVSVISDAGFVSKNTPIVVCEVIGPSVHILPIQNA